MSLPHLGWALARCLTKKQLLELGRTVLDSPSPDDCHRRGSEPNNSPDRSEQSNPAGVRDPLRYDFMPFANEGKIQLWGSH